MKNLRNISIAFLVIIHYQLEAKLPARTFPSAYESISVYRNTSVTFALKNQMVMEKNIFLSNTMTGLNASYITGHTKRSESTVSRVLSWDLKVKFRLNRNMNILFSYN